MFGMIVLVAVGLVLGYAVVAVGSLATTMGIASAAPQFVVRDHHLRPAYKLVQEAIWTVLSLLGGFVTAVVAGPSRLAWVAGAVLMAVLAGMLWTNTWEARQRGLPHQILITLLTFGGVAAGVFLRVHSA